MAQKVQVLLEDDIDGTEAAETISYAVDGTSYEIDLSEKNAAKFRKVMKEFIENSRRSASTGRGRPSSRPSAKGDGPDAKQVRKWATEHGIDVPARGRIPNEVIEQYRTAAAA